MARDEIPPRNASLPSPAPIAPEEWGMPITYCVDGETLATLRQVVNHEVATIPVDTLSERQWIAVVMARIKKAATFEFYMFGHGVVERERALKEVMERTNAGGVLTEIEQNLVRNLLQRALDE